MTDNRNSTQKLIDLNQFTTKRFQPGKGDLEAEKTALIIIDMMNLFCDPEWLSGGNIELQRWFSSELTQIIPNIAALLNEFRKTDGLVVHVVNAKWTLGGRDVVKYQKGRDYDLFDTIKMSVINELEPIQGEILIRKVASGAFTHTGLEFMLNNAGIENVALCGQYGSACAFYSLIQSREAGFNNLWIEDAMLYASPETKEIFQVLAGAFWAQLADTKSIIRSLTC